MIKIDADIIIVGGGAAGLMAAITAAERGADVLLLEMQERTGKKLSATGNGKCNFTNARMKAEHYFSSGNSGFVERVLEQFSPEDAAAFFEASGIAVLQKNGYYYPVAGQAELVREALLFRFQHGNASVHKCKCSCRVSQIRKEQDIFYVQLADGYEYTAGRVILACGSMAAPQLGGSELGDTLAHGLGHTLVPQLPALCGLRTSHPLWEKAAGVRIGAEISLYYQKSGNTVDGKNAQKLLIGTETGELQMTAYGISGISVFQLSGRAVRRLEQGFGVSLVIDFFPEKKWEGTVLSEVSPAGGDFVYEFLIKQKNAYPEKPMISVLSGILPEKLSSLLLTAVFGKQKKNRQETMQIQTVETADLEHLAHTVHCFTIPVTGATGFEHAQAASGGVSTDEIFPETMESRLVSGLYFAGEMMDVDGICGGYNLHWAWASGYLAGKSAAGRKENQC